MSIFSQSVNTLWNLTMMLHHYQDKELHENAEKRQNRVPGIWLCCYVIYKTKDWNIYKWKVEIVHRKAYIVGISSCLGSSDFDKSLLRGLTDVIFFKITIQGQSSCILRRCDFLLEILSFHAWKYAQYWKKLLPWVLSRVWKRDNKMGSEEQWFITLFSCCELQQETSALVSHQVSNGQLSP